jgi:5-methylcytosine-specific restriction endonuclease McrA
MAGRRRLPEISADAEALIDSLIATGRAERRRRPWLVWVPQWNTLDDEERQLLVAARRSAERHLEVQRRAARNRETARKAREKREAAARAERRRAVAKRRAWLTSKVPAFDNAQRWERVAWHEAYDRRHFPPHLSTILGITVGLILTFAAENVLIGVAAGLLSSAFVKRVERRVVRAAARRLLDVFAEAREQSRRIPRNLREAVIARDRGECVYCGANEDLHIDHIHPHSRGGTTVLGNLQILCSTCNIRKGTLSDVHARELLGSRPKEALAQELAVVGAQPSPSHLLAVRWFRRLRSRSDPHKIARRRFRNVTARRRPSDELGR